MTIKELAETIKAVVGYSGRLVFDKSKPDGMSQKLIDVRWLEQIGWKAKISLEDGLNRTYQVFKQNI